MSSEVSPSEPGGRNIRPISFRTYVVTTVFASLASLAMFLSHPPTLRVDGQHMASDVPPVTSMRGTFLPLRAIALGIGAVTSYDAKTGQIDVLRGRDIVVLHVSAHNGLLNGMPFTMRHAPFVVRGRVMVPAGLFERALGSTVRYDAAHESIEITTGHRDTKGPHIVATEPPDIP
jgi:hypothetical protein